MGCFKKRKDDLNVLQEHKFAYINLADFKSKSVVNWIAYFGIYAGVIISLARYAADIYTAVVLLVFNRWTNNLEQQEVINFDIAKWIFCGCIFLSFGLVGYEWIYAIKVIKTDGVAVAYMNAIAVRYNCIRGGPSKGDTGWKRFLVFSRLTKSRGFVDYIALFTYFAFHGWVRVIFAEGPRVVINTLTFISVTAVDKYVTDADNALNFVEKFIEGFRNLYEEDKVQVIVLCTMGFTTIMWVFSILRLLLSGILYLCFLWHAIGGKSLHDYCKERIDSRMGEIVKKKHDKALAKEKKKNDNLLRQPTIPLLGADTSSPKKDSDNMSMNSTTFLLSNQPSPPQSSSYLPANLKREPTLPNISELERGLGAPPPAKSAPHNNFQTPYESYGPVIDAYRDSPSASSTNLTGLTPAPPYSSLPPSSNNSIHNGIHGSGPSTFVVDRLAREQPPLPSGPPTRSLTNPSAQWNNPSMNSSPINSHFPPRGLPEHERWNTPPPPVRSQTAIPRPPQGPVPRGGTAPPMMRGPPQSQRPPRRGGYDAYDPGYPGSSRYDDRSNGDWSNNTNYPDNRGMSMYPEDPRSMSPPRRAPTIASQDSRYNPGNGGMPMYEEPQAMSPPRRAPTTASQDSRHNGRMPMYQESPRSMTPPQRTPTAGPQDSRPNPGSSGITMYQEPQPMSPPRRAATSGPQDSRSNNGMLAYPDDPRSMPPPRRAATAGPQESRQGVTRPYGPPQTPGPRAESARPQQQQPPPQPAASEWDWGLDQNQNQSQNQDQNSRMGGGGAGGQGGQGQGMF
ncbi:hypothetical protein EX30DRAFT_347494 [Ascodesmis nigricans]|uniref:Uncharacterized protein n=1 Tax=Ascodesmis nigricans TaxID=341454 RepID=A0A4S2N2Q9_9PEZI|nr:hypothetical protein EX30DRAFT_347494 [Ascodesmis nigricans]